MESFNYWFSNFGHWIYTREAALIAWKTQGIPGLPEYSEAAQ
jgi:hypothetical protein